MEREKGDEQQQQNDPHQQPLQAQYAPMMMDEEGNLVDHGSQSISGVATEPKAGGQTETAATAKGATPGPDTMSTTPTEPIIGDAETASLQDRREEDKAGQEAGTRPPEVPPRVKEAEDEPREENLEEQRQEKAPSPPPPGSMGGGNNTVRKELFGGALVCDLPSDYKDLSDFRQVPDHQEVFVREDVSIVIEILDFVAGLSQSGGSNGTTTPTTTTGNNPTTTSSSSGLSVEYFWTDLVEVNESFKAEVTWAGALPDTICSLLDPRFPKSGLVGTQQVLAAEQHASPPETEASLPPTGSGPGPGPGGACTAAAAEELSEEERAASLSAIVVDHVVIAMVNIRLAKVETDLLFTVNMPVRDSAEAQRVALAVAKGFTSTTEGGAAGGVGGGGGGGAQLESESESAAVVAKVEAMRDFRALLSTFQVLDWAVFC